VILPGTKATIPDLGWLDARGLSRRIQWLVAHDTPLLGICGGYQMLGRRVRDPLCLESTQPVMEGLGLFGFETVLGPEKRLARTAGTVAPGLPGIWGALGGADVEGYEIHAGRTDPSAARPLLRLRPRADGAVSDDGRIAGTYLHGMLEQPEPRRRLLRALATRRGFDWSPAKDPAADPYDILADTLEASLQLNVIQSLSSGERMRLSATESRNLEREVEGEQPSAESPQTFDN
jgi:adenosylcobyric acid synthase